MVCSNTRASDSYSQALRLAADSRYCVPFRRAAGWGSERAVGWGSGWSSERAVGWGSGWSSERAVGWGSGWGFGWSSERAVGWGSACRGAPSADVSAAGCRG